MPNSDLDRTSITRLRRSMRIELRMVRDVASTLTGSEDAHMTQAANHCPECEGANLKLLTRNPERVGYERRTCECVDCGHSFRRLFDIRFSQPVSED